MHSVNDALALVLQAKERQDRADGTLVMYRQKAEQIRRCLGGDTDIAKLTADDIDAYISLRDEAVTRHSIQKELIVLKQALALAYNRGWLAQDPARLFTKGFNPKYEPRREFLPQEKWPVLLDAFPPHRAAHIAFMIATGANLGESERALRRHIDLKRGMVFIDGTKRITRQRWVPITVLSRTLIQRVLRDAPGKGPDDPLFSPWGQIWRDLDARCQKLGLPHLSSNDLRRTFGSILVQNGVPFEVVAKLMGHANTTMVYKVYGQMRPEHLKNLVEQYLPSEQGSGMLPELSRL